MQHYPFPVYFKKAFSNRSIVLHGAKRPASRLWAFASQRGGGKFIPLERSCGECRTMGWVSYRPAPPARPTFDRWQCCGASSTAVDDDDTAGAAAVLQDTAPARGIPIGRREATRTQPSKSRRQLPTRLQGRKGGRQARAGDSPAPVLVALGVLSTMTGFGRGRSSGGQSFMRRQLMRNATSEYLAHENHPCVALRFLLAWPNSYNESRLETRHRADVARFQDEQARHGDMIALNMTEGFFRCPLKYLQWLQLAPVLFADAQWIALADDDIFVALDRLALELRLVATLTAGDSEPILWGLVTWKTFMNNRSLDTSTGFTGWSYADHVAARKREALERCYAAATPHVDASGMLNVSGVTECRQLLAGGQVPEAGRKGSTKMISAVQRRAIDETPPWPMVNGPLFAVSRELAHRIGDDQIPPSWLHTIHNTEFARWSERKHGKVPHVLQHLSCFPMGDSVFGFWIAAMAREGHMPNLTLVNSPLGIQHLPWPSWQFDNRSIVLHGLKGAHNPFWKYASRRARGRFVPTPRVCDTCSQMGWVTYPGSFARDWRCCGDRAPRPSGASHHRSSGTGKQAGRNRKEERSARQAHVVGLGA